MANGQRICGEVEEPGGTWVPGGRRRRRRDGCGRRSRGKGGVVRDGFVLDFISGTKVLRETAREQVRQRIARALFHEYGVSVDDMEPDFPAPVGGRRRRVDLAIFGSGEEHTLGNLQRVVVCRPEPKQNKRGAVKMRDYEQAAKDLDEIKPFFEEIEACQYGLWTNGLEFFFLRKKATKFQVDAEPIGDWPPADETVGERGVLSRARARRADPEMLRTAFRRCHNFIHGNEGMPKDAAFWQFLYLIFCKMYDERTPRDRRRFWAGPQEQFTDVGRSGIRRRIAPLFAEVKHEYGTIFQGSEEISLTDRALAFMISELSKYEFTRIDVDAKGAAYQEIVGTNLRGDRGQYFTPRAAIRLVVEVCQRGPAGGDLHRGGQRQHPDQPAVPQEEAGRGHQARSHRRTGGLPHLHGGRREGRLRSAREHAVQTLPRG